MATNVAIALESQVLALFPASRCDEIDGVGTALSDRESNEDWLSGDCSMPLPMKTLKEASIELGIPEKEIRAMIDMRKIRAVWRKNQLTIAPDEIGKIKRLRKSLPESALPSTPAPPKAPPAAVAAKGPAANKGPAVKPAPTSGAAPSRPALKLPPPPPQ